MPKVTVAITGVSIEVEAGEISVGDLSELAMGMLERANKVETIKSNGSAIGFTAERRDTKYYPSSIVNPEVRGK